jgi:hypothetical protein
MYITDLHQLIRDLVREKFFGTLEIRFDSGHVSVIKKIESLKILGDEPSRLREVSNEHR